ncbi:MAG: ABC transporter substrate-binding protein [Candidatus Tectomicrobia bacterium]|nr:ABC transporter substrate-binding protein [Candidatus Tectomicrobia bacterium]
MGGKRWSLIGVAILLWMLAPTSQAAEKAKFVTSWVLYGADAYLYAAREKGFFRKAGFDVEINRGRGSGNTIQEVSLHLFDFGFADTGALVAGRTKGAKAKEIAVMYSKAPHAIAFLKASGIRTPKDLEGRTLSDTQGAATQRTLPAFATLAGFDITKVKFLYMDSPSRLPSVLAGKADGLPFFLTELPLVEAESRKQNKEVGVFLWADYGFRIYSNGIIAHQDDIANKPDRLRRFLKAAVEGWAYGLDHPEEAAQLFLRFHPEQSPQIVLAQWKVAASLSDSPETRQNGLGYVLHDKMKTTRDIMVKAMDLKGDVKVEDLYTNVFNPKVFPKSWK